MIAFWWLLPVGVLLGAFGTLIGAGGGFLLVPLLLLLYPQENPEVVTSISLAVVFFNAASGSWAYARMRRIDYRAALFFSLAAVPGAVLGALSTSFIPRRLFDGILGVVMLAVAVYLLVRPRGEGHSADLAAAEPGDLTGERAAGPPAHRRRTGLGMLLSVMVGYVSSLLGIGGGIVHVPLLARVLRFPVHVATATSHMILAVMALAGTVVHIATGTFTHGYRRTVALAIGVIVGAQLGAYVSNRIHGRWIIRSLAVALVFVGVRILVLALAGDSGM
jgi:uncharacterized membrane protein YfcA